MKLIKGVFLLLNILAAAALVFVKIGSVVNPNTFIFPAYASLGLLPFVIINVGFILIWIIFKKWYFLLSFVTIILFSSTIKSVYPINFTKTEIDSTYQKISLLSYNTMNTGMMKKHKPGDPNQVIQYILDSDADIVCLQEFAISQNENQFQNDDFERIFKKYPHKHVSFQLDKWSMNIGVATLSKFPIIEKRNVNYHSEFNMSIYSDILIGNDTIRVINNHLESNRITAQDMKETSELRSEFSSERLSSVTKYLSQKLSVAYKVRAEQAVVVSDLINKSPYKIISCGDLNDVPASYTYTKVKGNLKDAFKESGNGTGWTFVQQLYRFRIDYIMYDRAFFSDNFKIGKLRESDHYPVSADIYLPTVH